MKKSIIYILLLSLIAGCSSAKRSLQKSTQKVFESAFYDNQFTGFLVVDSHNNDILFDFNGEKYFTPASNTKIFTLFTSLQLLSDSIPALKYIAQNDTLYIEGTGDPTFLHSHFENNNTLDFLKKHNNISLFLNNFKDEKYGPGWAWEDYQYYFQPEIGAFPMYGNVTTLYNATDTKVTPSYFNDAILATDSHKNREIESNQFHFSPTRKDTLETPFKTSHNLTKNLLQKSLNRSVSIVENMPNGEKQVLYSVATDTILKRMMHESDNFLAEQLLILASSTLSDSLSASLVQKYILENQLGNLKHKPRWVDGSGLSRYNLFTPESMVHVLSKMYKETPKEKLFNFFPSGGKGTLKDWYQGDPKSYLFAKTGSVGNNHNISGYLITKSGKTLIFSFMNNHFRKPSAQIKNQMEHIFEEIRDNF